VNTVFANVPSQPVRREDGLQVLASQKKGKRDFIDDFIMGNITRPTAEELGVDSTMDQDEDETEYGHLGDDLMP
jgi:hypothetical protein